ncbi:uncharacterized protein BDW47DRAFT_105442 [Aspergillus candidus]|uniref:Uncharacterized protein n=1 Tax=Aspergillus candidus TaxID=41067 RepID=A0A2I2FC27_ASPCN|nr:hypothetical protein BDW47DRAFT_105442 [Aspergillus candidus]PLB38183.1 hypothetical protein BDW47DRAFT_105442 [Aspergillus candidus]
MAGGRLLPFTENKDHVVFIWACILFCFLTRIYERTKTPLLNLPQSRSHPTRQVVKVCLSDRLTD